MKPKLIAFNGEWFCISAVTVACGTTMFEAYSRWYAMRIFA